MTVDEMNKRAIESAQFLSNYCLKHVSCKKCIFCYNVDGFSQCELYTTPSHYSMNLINQKIK